MAGTTLNHYNILSKLGSGGMGEVYVAEDTRLNRRVALKILPPGLEEKLERRERFKREAQAVAALNHPNIIKIHLERGDRVIARDYLQRFLDHWGDGELDRERVEEVRERLTTL